MRIKTFLAAYVLFLIVMFSCFGIISGFMTDTQMDMYMERSGAEYRRIAGSLARDIAVLYGISNNIAEDINALVNNYMAHYAQSNVFLALGGASDGDSAAATVSFMHINGRYFIQVIGTLPEPFGLLQLIYLHDITDTILNMRHVQNVLLVICIAFSVVTAFVLHFMLARIFRPLRFVSLASRNIATGNYNERITLKGNNELTAMADDFNTMAKEIERQIQILKEEADGKQQFADNFAHEIRTPLTSIYGYAEYMQKVSLKEDEIIESAQHIMDEANHMKNIADSLLFLATLRGYEAVCVELSIPSLFEYVKQSLKKAIGTQQIQFDYKIDTDTLYGQEDLIKSLLTNLCTNAVTALPEVGGIITLTAEKSNAHVILTITDNGRGIPPHSLPKITDPFYRADQARNRGQGGAGLGLALCKRITEAHGAEMAIASTPGIGTKVTLTFTIPLHNANNVKT
jgi:signal transduction histidine kinase